MLPCVFGTPADDATRKFAVIGDSHASHWRAALRPIAKKRGWRGTSLARSHCPYAAGDPGLAGEDRVGCLAWREQVPRWLARHPEIDTIVVAQFEGAAASAADFVAGWERLPASVERVLVIRDNPQMLPGGETNACVQEAMDDAKPAGWACRRRREHALPADPAAEAANRSDRAMLVDATEFSCDEQWCRPVIGGALVYKDANHITSVYGATLAPYLGREVDRALRDAV